MTTTTREARAAGEVQDAGPRPAIDPRLRARRVEVRRSEGRRRLRVLVIAAGVVGALALLAGLLFTPLFDVDRVTVAGQFRTDPADVVAAAGIERGEPLVTADLAGAERRIEALPWVDEATVVRSWPGTLRYRVVERVPAAAAQGPDGSWVAIDGDGRVLVGLDAEPTDLPVVEGVTVDPTVGASVPDDAAGAFAVAAAIPPSARPAVDAVLVDADGAVTVRLDAGGVATIGPLEDLPAKGVALASVIAAVDPCIATLDLTVASAPLLTRAPGCS